MIGFIVGALAGLAGMLVHHEQYDYATTVALLTIATLVWDGPIR